MFDHISNYLKVMKKYSAAQLYPGILKMRQNRILSVWFIILRGYFYTTFESVRIKTIIFKGEQPPPPRIIRAIS